MFVIDELARRQSGGGWIARADMARIGMAGHSFGAVTVQYLAGQRAADPQTAAQSMSASKNIPVALTSRVTPLALPHCRGSCLVIRAARGFCSATAARDACFLGLTRAAIQRPMP